MVSPHISFHTATLFFSDTNSMKKALNLFLRHDAYVHIRYTVVLRLSNCLLLLPITKGTINLRHPKSSNFKKGQLRHCESSDFITPCTRLCQTLYQTMLDLVLNTDLDWPGRQTLSYLVPDIVIPCTRFCHTLYPITVTTCRMGQLFEFQVFPLKKLLCYYDVIWQKTM